VAIDGIFTLFEGNVGKGMQRCGVIAGYFQDAMNKVVAKCTPAQSGICLVGIHCGY
jgi:hypothetical protein